jgi:mRNA interferase MazF
MLNAGNIVLVAFPYADSNAKKFRPALVISGKALHKRHGICWVAMITSAENQPWDGDIALPAGKLSGLDKPSVIRPAKLATLDLDKMEKIGAVSAAILTNVRRFLSDALAG